MTGWGWATRVRAVAGRAPVVVRVSGASMVPTVRHGDLVLVRRGARIRPGDVVIGRYYAGPPHRVIKRAVRPVGTGWWLASDNRFAGGDSAVHGIASVEGRAWLRYRPRGWPLVRLGRRAPGDPPI